MYQGFTHVILVILVAVVGLVGVYYLASQLSPSTPTSTEDELSSVYMEDQVNSPTPSAPLQTSMPDWTTTRTVAISTCNVSVELPAQDSYVPTQVSNLADQAKLDKKWSIYEERDANIYMAPGLNYDKAVRISYLPDGLPRSAFACGPGCVSEASVHLYCKSDARTNDEIVNDLEKSLSGEGESTPKFISKKAVTLGGQQAYEVEHGAAADFPAGKFYIFSKNGVSYHVGTLGNEEIVNPVLQNLHF